MSVKYPNIISKISDETVNDFAEALAESDDKFREKLLEFCQDWGFDLLTRVLRDAPELLILWATQKYKLENMEKLLSIEEKNEEVSGETHAMSGSE